MHFGQIANVTVRLAHTVRWPWVLAATVLGAPTVGWFLLSRLVAHNDVRTAIREAVGVGLALLVLVSTFGAIRNSGQRFHGGE